MSGEIPLVPMVLREIQATESVGAQIMILAEVGGARRFPIFIGFHEMDALDRAIHGKITPRPLTHDLILNVIESVGGELQRVVIDDLKDETFYGKLGIRLADGSEVFVDSRPSDAIAIAVRAKVPIYVDESVLDRAGVLLNAAGEPIETAEGRTGGVTPEERARLAAFSDFIAELDLDDFE